MICSAEMERASISSSRTGTFPFNLLAPRISRAPRWALRVERCWWLDSPSTSPPRLARNAVQWAVWELLKLCCLFPVCLPTPGPISISSLFSDNACSLAPIEPTETSEKSLRLLFLLSYFFLSPVVLGKSIRLLICLVFMNECKSLSRFCYCFLVNVLPF